MTGKVMRCSQQRFLLFDSDLPRRDPCKADTLWHLCAANRCWWSGWRSPGERGSTCTCSWKPAGHNCVSNSEYGGKNGNLPWCVGARFRTCMGSSQSPNAATASSACRTALPTFGWCGRNSASFSRTFPGRSFCQALQQHGFSAQQCRKFLINFVRAHIKGVLDE